MKTKYTTIKASTLYADENGVAYPDIFTFPISNFVYSKAPQKYCLGIRDIYRFDLLISEFYDGSDCDDLVLWLNNIEHIADVSPGTEILLPSREDIDIFYRDNFI